MNERLVPRAGSAGALPPANGPRLQSLDLIRGFAVLGIVLMNVQSFAMPDAAYTNPAAFGDLHGHNTVAWALTHLLVNQKFNALFALLFGAGICLFLAAGPGQEPRPLTLHYRRLFWLLLFGLAHFYLLWWGDILCYYALAGAVAVLFRRLPAAALLGCSLLFLGIGALDEVDLWSALIDPGSMYEDFDASWFPPRIELVHELELFRGDWWDQVRARQYLMAGYFSLGALTPLFLLIVLARTIGLMLLGMWLFRRGVFAGAPYASPGVITALLAVGGGATALNMGINLHSGFDSGYNLFIGRSIDYGASLLLALGYLGLLLAWARGTRAAPLQACLRATGRIAFTNYISQSLLGTALFYGWGLGWFGMVDRAGQLGIALAIIALQLWWSPRLLAHCRAGPLEWLWRCLTAWRWQPLRRRGETT